MNNFSRVVFLVVGSLTAAAGCNSGGDSSDGVQASDANDVAATDGGTESGITPDAATAGCTSESECTETNFCDVESGQCGQCEKHQDCASNDCVDGVCRATSDVLFLDVGHPNGSDQAGCQKEAPCQSWQGIFENLSEERNFVVLKGSIDNVDLAARKVTIVGDPTIGGMIYKNPDVAGAAVHLLGENANVVLRNLTISGSAQGDAINCTAGNLVVDNVILENGRNGINSWGCHVSVSGSQIRKNVEAGVYAWFGSVKLDNVVVADNGFSENGFGGVYMKQAGASINFTTFSNNRDALKLVQPGRSGGLSCENAAVTVSNSIFWKNQTVSRGQHDIGEGCGVSQSLFVNDAKLTATMKAGGQYYGDPKFVNAGSDPDTNDYHLSPGSAALDKTTATGKVLDMDGQARPQAAGKSDLGADEMM